MAKEEQNLDMEAQIDRALLSRIQHFKQNADSLTLESVRRLLEKDLGLEAFALDVHKRFIKQTLEKHMEDLDNANDVSTDSEINVEKINSSTKEAELPKKNVMEKDLKEPASGDETKMEDSPVMGLMNPKADTVDAESTVTNENNIKKAIWHRAAHIRDNAETITLVAIRRLLEEDMGLPTNSLDLFKKFIRSQIDEVLVSSEVSKSKSGVKKAKASVSEKKVSETNSGSLGSENEEVDDKVKSRKKTMGSRENKEKSQGMKKRKGPQKEINVSSKKQKKPAKQPSEKDADNVDEDSGNDVHSDSSSEKTAKKKQVSTPVHGKRVENLKSIIKACGMSVAPTVYKKAKQVPDNKREAFLIKELEEILSREGLSANPSEKEIKEVKKRKERAKELEGIDLSNIVTSSRRRSTTNYMAPAQPKLHDEGESGDAKSSKKKNGKGESNGAKYSKKSKNDKGEDEDTDDEAKSKKEKEEGEKEEEEEEQEVEEGHDDEDDDEDDDDEDDDDSQSEEFNEDEEDSD